MRERGKEGEGERERERVSIDRGKKAAAVCGGGTCGRITLVDV